MYSLVKALVKPINSQGRWIEKDIANLTMPELYSQYDRVLATLSNPFLTDNVCLDLAAIRPQTGGLNITFTQFLTNNGNLTLPTSPTLPQLNTQYGEYSDAFRAGYKVTAVHESASPGSDLPPSELKWLLLTRELTDYSLFFESCLVSVNGFLHATDASTDGVYVKDGMTSKMMSNKADLGIYSLRKLGKIRQIPITADMLYKQTDDQVFKERVHIDLGEDVSQQSVFLVLGGYLHVLDKQTFYRTGDSTFSVHTAGLPLIERYFESRKYIDLSSMNLDIPDTNPEQLAVNSFYNDTAMTAYFTLSQSFFVVLDNSEIFVEKEPLEVKKLPGHYESRVLPIFPAMGELGKMNNYWSMKGSDSRAIFNNESDRWGVYCADAYRNEYQFSTIPKAAQVNVSSARIPGASVRNGNLYFLKLGTDISLN